MLRERLMSDRVLDGLFINGRAADVVEMAGLAKFDYVVLDGEHGDVWPVLPELIRAARFRQIAAIVRVPKARLEAMSQVMDWGADGVLVPAVRTIEEIQRAVRAVRYPPEGERGLATSVAAADYGWKGDTYLSEARANSLLWIQLETQEALDALDDWADLDGADLFFVGPADLSMALGEQGRPGPRFHAAMETIQATLRGRKPWGIFAGSPADRTRWHALGAVAVATSVPLVLKQGVDLWRGDEKAG